MAVTASCSVCPVTSGILAVVGWAGVVAVVVGVVVVASSVVVLAVVVVDACVVVAADGALATESVTWEPFATLAPAFGSCATTVPAGRSELMDFFAEASPSASRVVSCGRPPTRR